jgi:hypothetical protein
MTDFYLKTPGANLPIRQRSVIHLAVFSVPD